MNYHIDGLLYGYLQTIATYSPRGNKLYISKKTFSKNKKVIYTLCDMNSSKLRRQIDKFIEKGLISEGEVYAENGDLLPSYIFPQNYPRYEILDFEILKKLINTKSKIGVKIYIYLLNRYKWVIKDEDCEGYVFTNKELMKAIGYSGSRNNLIEEAIKDVLEDLRQTHFINYVEYYDLMRDKDGEIIYDDTGCSIPIPKKKLTFIAEESSSCIEYKKIEPKEKTIKKGPCQFVF